MNRLKHSKKHINPCNTEVLICRSKCAHCEHVIISHFRNGDPHETVNRCAMCGMWQRVSSDVQYMAHAAKVEWE